MRKSRLGMLTFLCLFYSISIGAVGKTEDDKVLMWAGDSSNRYSYMEPVARDYRLKYGITVELESVGTLGSLEHVIDNNSQLGGIGRYLTRREQRELDLKVLPIAWDALVVVVHPRNQISELSTAQLKGIFDGSISRWSDLKKELSGDINLHVRSSMFSGVGYSLRGQLFSDVDTKFTETDFVYPNSELLESAVERNEGGIGVTGYSSAIRKQLKIIRIDNKFPSKQNVIKGEYKFYRTLYFTYRASNRNHTGISHFIDFLTSSEGQQSIRSSGAIPYLDAVPLVTIKLKQESTIKNLDKY